MAGAIAWVQWPRPPVLDGERWFKTLLVSLLQGWVEARGGDADAFEEAVVRYVPYHPAGRFPERKVTHPDLAVPAPALDGERALCDALSALPTLEARWRRLYDEDEMGLDARLSDPHELGPVYDPATVMGPNAGWDAVAAWGAEADQAKALREALDRTFGARWVLVSGMPTSGPTLLDALARQLEGRVVRLSEAHADTLGALADDGPLVLVGEGSAVPDLLQALLDNVVLRDRVYAVVSLGGVIGGRTDVDEGPLSVPARRDWLGAHFRQRSLETDLVRLTPYFALQWLDRAVEEPGVMGLPLVSQRFPDPDATDASAETVEVVDLGPLPVDPDLPRDLVARALVVCVTAWVANRR